MEDLQLPQGVVKQGWLGKKGATLRMFKDRYVLLGDGFVQYYDREVDSLEIGEDGGLQGQVFLAGGRIERESSNAFRIITDNREMVFQVNGGSNHDADQDPTTTCQEWVNLILEQAEHANIITLARREARLYRGVIHWMSVKQEEFETKLQEFETPVTLAKYFRWLCFLSSHERMCYIKHNSSGTLVLYWRSSTGQEGTANNVPVNDIVDVIRQGRDATFARMNSVQRACCFTVVCRDGRYLDLQAPSAEIVDRWTDGLKWLSDYLKIAPLMEQNKEPKRKQSISALRLKSLLDASGIHR